MALLCLIDGVLVSATDTIAAPVSQPKSRQRAALFSLIRAGFSSSRFWADLGLSLIITLVLLAIAYATVGQIPILAAAFLMPLIIFGLLVGPIAMFIIGMLRGRPGFAIAPICILLAVAGARYVNLEFATYRAKETVEEAAGINVYPFADRKSVV